MFTVLLAVLFVIALLVCFVCLLAFALPVAVAVGIILLGVGLVLFILRVIFKIALFPFGLF